MEYIFFAVFVLFTGNVFALEEQSKLATTSGRNRQRSFLYKCNEDVRENFWPVPDQFRMFYEEEKWEYFTEQYNESMFNFTLEKWTQSCSDTFFANVSLESNDVPYWEDGASGLHFNFTPDGYLAYIKGEEEIYFDRENYCIESLTAELIKVKFCKSKCFHEKGEYGSNICVPKCCPIGLAMKDMKDEPCMCVEAPTDWTPTIYNSLTSAKQSQAHPQLHYIDPTTVSCMNDSVEFRIHSTSELRILSDGRIFTRKPGQTSVLAWEPVYTGTEAFCVDGFWQSDTYDVATSKLFVTTCGMTERSIQEKQELAQTLDRHLLHSKIVWVMIYVPCAIIHLVILFVYVLLWNKHNSHGWTAMALSASQLLLYGVLLTLVGAVLLDQIDVLVKGPWRPLCAALGILHHFAELSCYSWTVVLTFDVWRRFSSLAPWSQQGRKRFCLYCCFGIGVPAAIVVAACVMEWSLRDFEGHKIEPGYSSYCTVFGQEAYLAYMGIPSAAMFAINSVLALFAFKNAWKMKSMEAKTIKTSRMDRLALMGKLIFLAGIFLIFEFIFNFTGLIDISIYFTILELYRLLYALGLFWIFVCNRKIVGLLCFKFPCLLRFAKEKASVTNADAVFYNTRTTT